MQTMRIMSARTDKAPAFMKAIRSMYFLNQFADRCEDERCLERLDKACLKAMHQLNKEIADNQVPINNTHRFQA